MCDKKELKNAMDELSKATVDLLIGLAPVENKKDAEKSIEDFLDECWNGKSKESLTEVLNNAIKALSENIESCKCKNCECNKDEDKKEVDLEALADSLNKSFANAREDVEKKQKKILIDSPIQTDMNKKNSFSLNVENAIEASLLPHVRYMSNKEIAEHMLEDMFEVIKDIADDGEHEIIIDLVEDYDEYLYDREQSDVFDIVKICVDFLQSKGYKAKFDSDFSESLMKIEW